MGLLINIEAIDRAGKTTQVRAVLDALREAGIRVDTMAFPDTPSRSRETTGAHFATGVLIERWLDGKLAMIDGRDSLFRLDELRDLSDDAKTAIIANVDEKLFQVLLSVNRRERRRALLNALEEHDVVLVVRYLSARTYGVAGGVSRLQIDAIEGELPVPDLTVLLDLDPTVARARRAEEGYDRYEADADFQSKVRRLYNEMVREDAEAAEVEGRPPAFVRLDAAEPAEQITSSIVRIVRERLKGAE